MKITTWIRPDPRDPTGRSIAMRTKCDPESLDNPVIQRYGRRIAAALEGDTVSGKGAVDAQGEG